MSGTIRMRVRIPSEVVRSRIEAIHATGLIVRADEETGCSIVEAIDGSVIDPRIEQELTLLEYFAGLPA